MNRIAESSRQIAEIIGGVEPEFVDEVLVGLSEQKVAMHGIKRLESVAKVEIEGVAPNCPDDLPQRKSFWTAGLRSFLNGDAMAPTFDTSFFHYGNLGRVDGQIVMAAALTTKTALAELAAEHENAFDQGSDYFAVPFVVPRNVLHVVKVCVPNNEQIDARTNAQHAERQFLETLHDVATNGFQANK